MDLWCTRCVGTDSLSPGQLLWPLKSRSLSSRKVSKVHLNKLTWPAILSDIMLWKWIPVLSRHLYYLCSLASSKGSGPRRRQESRNIMSIPGWTEPVYRDGVPSVLISLLLVHVHKQYVAKKNCESLAKCSWHFAKLLSPWTLTMRAHRMWCSLYGCL